MSEGISYKSILSGHELYHAKKNPRQKALNKYKNEVKMTGRSQKEQMRFTRQNSEYQKKFGRAYND